MPVKRKVNAGNRKNRKVLLGSNRRLRNGRQEPLRSTVSCTLKDDRAVKRMARGAGATPKGISEILFAGKPSMGVFLGLFVDPLHAFIQLGADFGAEFQLLFGFL